MIRRTAAAVLGAILAGVASPSLGAAPSVTVNADQALRFGTFFTDTAGTRTVSATGSVTGSAIIPLTGAAPGPAQFTFTYDRGNNANVNLLALFCCQPSLMLFFQRCLLLPHMHGCRYAPVCTGEHALT